MKIKIFKKEKNFKKKDFNFNLNFYWEIVVFLAVAMLLFFAFFSYRFFVQTNREPALPAESGSNQVPKVSQERLTKVLNYFSEKEIKSVNIINSPAPVVDPS
jgi:hypothetical protein